MRQSSDQKKTSRIDWHPADIVAALHKAGWSVSRLAAHHEVATTSLSRAMRSSFPKSERRIAEALGLHPMVIWPSRYNVDGSRKPQGTRAIQCTCEVRARNVKDRAVA